ncbi:MAG TPA: VOC family protein [Tepidiformaceae bacterium]|nr:VOC family protein [Tepidiformaceae bacterium]
MTRLNRLNHAVLYVGDLDRSVEFYTKVFDFDVIANMGGQMAFLRARGSENHHDLGLFAVGKDAPKAPKGATGLYHLAWEVPAIEDLAEAATTLANLGALGGASDHGATKSLYAKDPDGNEFEVMWMVPREHWGEYENDAITAPLNLERELARWGSAAAV